MNRTRVPYGRHCLHRLWADYDYTVSEVRNALPIDTKILTCPKSGLIAWRKGQEGFHLRFGPYNEITYRLIIADARQSELPEWFWTIKIGPHLQDKLSIADAHHGSELSFHQNELSSIKGSDLVRFTEDCFRCAQEEDIYRWPLFFAHRQPKPWWAIGSADPLEPWQPDYAWTVLGKVEQTKRERAYRAHNALGSSAGEKLL
jgi:hypothetical protein